MSTLYEEALARLSNYRIKNHLSQEEMGNMMGITQSHYSKVEQGKKMISGTALLNLSNCNVDIDFFFTGEEALVTELDAYVAECKEEYREKLVELLVWLVNQGTAMMNKKDEWGEVDYAKEIELIHLLEWNMQARESIWYGIREVSDYTQKEMAEALDINIKKYREIEKEERIPDAEVLANLYEKTGILPSTLLNGTPKNFNALNRIWIQFDSSMKGKLLGILDQAFALFKQDISNQE